MNSKKQYEPFKAYLMSGSSCDISIDGNGSFTKRISKSLEGIENGYQKFYYEIKHMIEENKQFPGIYVPILHIDDSAEDYIVQMQFCYEGVTLSDLLRNIRYDQQYFKESLAFILDTLFYNYYSVRYDSIPDADYIDKYYPDRIERRLAILDDPAFIRQYGYNEKLMKMIQNGVVLNNVYYPPVATYLQHIRSDESMKSRLQIKYNTHSHHDLNPANILINTNQTRSRISEFRLIDPRGIGETGESVRHYMYDIGKLMMGFDVFDIFRIFNGKLNRKLYNLDYNSDGDTVIHVHLAFDLNDPIVIQYQNSMAVFWEIMKSRKFYSDSVHESEQTLALQYLFSLAHMYHPDIPCRIIFERDPEMAICMYIRGLMYLSIYMHTAYGKDPFIQGDLKGPIDLWPGMTDK